MWFLSFYPCPCSPKWCLQITKNQQSPSIPCEQTQPTSLYSQLHISTFLCWFFLRPDPNKEEFSLNINLLINSTSNLNLARRGFMRRLWGSKLCESNYESWSEVNKLNIQQIWEPSTSNRSHNVCQCILEVFRSMQSSNSKLDVYIMYLYNLAIFLAIFHSPKNSQRKFK